MSDLSAFDAKFAQIAELHVFAGLEFAELPKTSERSIYRDWRLVRIFLRKAMHVEVESL